MYNLLVSGIEGTWDSGRCAFPRSRFGEYTADTIKARFDLTEPDTLERLLTLPALFAYEQRVGEPARVGELTEIRVAARGELRVEYEFDERIPSIEGDRIAELEWELDIDGWEMSRTHWAIKDVDLFAVLRDAELTTAEDFRVEASPGIDERGLIERLEALENMALSRATGGSVRDKEWADLREDLISDPRIERSLPRFVRTCTTPHQLFRQSQSWGGYTERRQRIAEAFAQTREALCVQEAPGINQVSNALTDLNSEYVFEQWEAALERVPSDPDGAITLARSFLESVFKHVLEDLGEEHSSADTLPGLFRRVARRLDIAPDQQTDPEFRKLLGAATTIVDTTAAIRNRLGDAHGRGRGDARALPDHAELAVNAAGSIASFVILRWRSRQG